MLGILIPTGNAQTNGRIIEFANRQWYVKAGTGLGPGPNDFSDDEQSVWVDEQGRLHLRMRNIDGVWHSAEVYSVEPTTYGTHRYYVDTPVNDLDPNVVLGMFIYENDANEIDVEIARFNNADGLNGQFVIQPASATTEQDFSVAESGPTLHEFNWQPNVVQFRSLNGHDPIGSPVINEWQFTGNNIPDTSPDMRIRINLWLWRGAGASAPARGQEIEIVISALEAPSSVTQVDCTSIDLTSVITSLTQANVDFATGDTTSAVATIAEARATLQAIETQCGMSTTSVPDATSAPPTTTEDEPSITFDIDESTTVGENGEVLITGTVSPATYCSDNYAVAIYVYPPNDLWNVQPFADERRYININTDCTWRSMTDIGDGYRYVVLLVPRTAAIPAMVRTTDCPPDTGDFVIASQCSP